jgi:RNA polymerase primary sigma factor
MGLKLTRGTGEDPGDVVCMYLREAGRISLLTRCSEVKVAKRIERGELDTLKALSRSAMTINEIRGLPAELAAGERSIQQIVLPDQEEWTNEGLVRRRCELIALVGEIERLNRRLSGLRANDHAKQTSGRARSWAIARQRVRISRLIRSIGFTSAERLRLIGKIREIVETQNSLELELN